MSQNAKQLSLQIRRCATPPYFLLLYSVGLCCVAVEHAPSLCFPCFLVLLMLCKKVCSHLASDGCNMWEMELTEDLHMLWMHVDGSP